MGRSLGKAFGLAGICWMLTACSLGDVKPLPVPSFSGHFADQKVDLEFAPEPSSQKLDLYVPDGERPSPLVILVHPGAWQTGDKADFGQATITAFTKAGYAVASINYRLTPDGEWPAGVQDAKAAVRWLRANAAKYHLDPDRFAMLGTSAGGYLATAVGLTGERQSNFDDPQLGNPKVSAAVQAVILWSTPTDFRSLDSQLAAAGCPPASRLHGLAGSPESKWLGETVGQGGPVVRQSNLLRYVQGAIQPPPFQIAHGLADCTIPPAQSRNLNTVLRRARIPTSFGLFKGMKHDDPRFRTRLVQLAVKFLDRHLA